MNPGMRRTSVLLLSAILVLCLFAACGAASSSPAASSTAAATAADNAYYETATETAVMVGGEVDADYAPLPEAAAEAPDSGGMGGANVVVQQSSEDRKIVITVDLGLQTMEFDAGIGAIQALTEQTGGYIEYSYVSDNGLGERYTSRSANYTVRIPTERLNEFLAAISGSFHVVYQQQSSTDISVDYFDTEARLTSLRVQEERLMAMLEQSGELEYLLKVERELADVLYQIEQMTSSLNRMDSTINFTAVTMNLSEVVEYDDLTDEPATFGERIAETFGDSWEGFKSFCQQLVLFLIALVPFLPLVAVVVVVVVILVRRERKRRLANPRPYFYSPYQQPQQPQQTNEEPPKPEDDQGKE